MKVDLGEYQPGAYVVLDDIVTYGTMKKVFQMAQREKDGGDSGDFGEFVFRELVSEANIRDKYGNLVDPAKEGALDTVDMRIVNVLITEARKLIGGNSDDPNSESASSTS